MKQLFLTSLIMFTVTYVFAQGCNISLRPIVATSNHSELCEQAVNYLSNRLRSLTSMASANGGLENSQFALAADYDVIDKQIVSGAPSKVVYKIYLSLYVVDFKGEKVYSSYSKELRGIGNNETAALINTFSKINIANNEIRSFVEQGRQKIVTYYDSNYAQIIKTAKTMAAVRKFDAAIYNLMSVPECCKGFSEVAEALVDVYKQFVNQHCKENLAQARSAWIASPNSEGAATASVYLSEIYPDADCYGDAMQFAQEIKEQMGEEWKFQMRQWSDSVSLERQRIEAMRTIGMAYANSLPQNPVTNIFWK